MVLNVTMLESNASMFIQLIDVLAGCVIYQFRRKKSEHLASNMHKLEISNYLASELSKSTLAEDFIVDNPVYFHVQVFKNN